MIDFAIPVGIISLILVLANALFVTHLLANDEKLTNFLSNLIEFRIKQPKLCITCCIMLLCFIFIFILTLPLAATIFYLIAFPSLPVTMIWVIYFKDLFMKTAVVFSGAGLSAESGIPTFRDSDGLWENHKVDDVATPEGWARDKELVIKFYQQRYESVKKAEPNPAHLAIAKLQDKFNVVNLTQNVDDLLERAGCNDVRHFHGSINKRKCEWHKSACMLDGDTKYTCNYSCDHTEAVKLGDLCPVCGGQTRPDVVWFGEPVAFEFESIRELVKEVKYNDGVFICVGTSAQVHPAAALIPFFAQVKNKWIVDKKPRPISNYTLLVGSAGVVLPDLVEKILKG